MLSPLQGGTDWTCNGGETRFSHTEEEERVRTYIRAAYGGLGGQLDWGGRPDYKGSGRDAEELLGDDLGPKAGFWADWEGPNLTEGWDVPLPAGYKTGDSRETPIIISSAPQVAPALPNALVDIVVASSDLDIEMTEATKKAEGLAASSHAPTVEEEEEGTKDDKMTGNEKPKEVEPEDTEKDAEMEGVDKLTPQLARNLDSETAGLLACALRGLTRVASNRCWGRAPGWWPT